MGVSNVDSNQLSNQLGQSLSGNPPSLTPATAVYQKGAYSIPGYAGALKTWFNNFDNYKKNPQVKSVSLSNGKHVSLQNFGFTDTSGSAGVSGWVPFISFGTSFNSSDSRESLDVEKESYSIDIKLTYGAMQAFPINPGNWFVKPSPPSIF